MKDKAGSAASGAVAAVQAAVNSRLPRGLRNNNPFNIRKSNIKWAGKVVGTDSAFETFSTMEAGLRAGMTNMRTHYTKYGDTTLRKLINRHAPASDGNNVSAYVAAVSAATGLGPDARVEWTDKAVLARLFDRVVKVENGAGLALSLIQTVISKYAI
jgi:hypothetical protein